MKYRRPERVFLLMLLCAFSGIARLVPLFTLCIFRRASLCLNERFVAWRLRRPSELRDDKSTSESERAWGNKTPGHGESIPSHIPATFQASRSNFASSWRCRSCSVFSDRASTTFPTDDSRLACPAPRRRSPATPSPSRTPARPYPAICRAGTTAEMIAAGCSRIGKNCVNSYTQHCVNSFVPNARNDRTQLQLPL